MHEASFTYRAAPSQDAARYKGLAPNATARPKNRVPNYGTFLDPTMSSNDRMIDFGALLDHAPFIDQ